MASHDYMLKKDKREYDILLLLLLSMLSAANICPSKRLENLFYIFQIQTSILHW